jgi:hypothetical protein
MSRGVGLVFFISFASLSWQVLPFAGKRGITPIAESLSAIAEHFPTWKRFAYFPSLLWFNSSDAFLRALPWLGMAASAGLMLGGAAAPWLFAAVYVIYLSLDRPMILVYPWDCLLFEAGFWGMFLPATRMLPSLESVAAPLPAVAWVFRLLVFRVMFGFGKHKFMGTTPQDKAFLKSFFVNQPLPNPPGWAAAKLPIWAHKLALLVMFLAEIPMPFLVFFPGPYSALGGASFIALMLGIWATGNFGYFNIAVIALSLSWFDTTTALAPAQGPLAVQLLAVLHTALALLCLPFNTFCAQVFMLWPVWRRVRPGFLAWPITLLRALHPLHWVHAYGVFPPRVPPPIKILPIIEASWDGEAWHTLEHPYSPSVETSRPRFCAPHHNRFDQAVVYEGLGLNEASILRNVVGRFDPYGYGGVPGPLLLIHRILDGTVPETHFYDRTLEKKLGPPLWARVRTHMFEPTGLREASETGRYWRRTLVGPHYPPMRREDGYWDQPLPSPELWHFDDLVWLRRSHLGPLMERATRGEDPHALALLGAKELRPEDARELWDGFLPKILAHGSHDWRGVRGVALRIREEYGRARLHRFERLIGRYAILLLARLEPLFLDGGFSAILGKKPATLDVKTHHHLRLLCQHIMSEGQSTYDSVFREPASAAAFVPQMTLSSGYYFQAVLRYEAFVYQSQKLRLFEAYEQHRGRPAPTDKQRQNLERMGAIVRRIIGPIEIVEFLKTQFAGPEDILDIPENWPHFELLATGEVRRLEPLPCGCKECQNT